ncbi:MAG TPA: hypothetical protein VN035_14630 [Microbacterium sp.]|nr:hypothetical protein [Microbacterium sp.]
MPITRDRRVTNRWGGVAIAALALIAALIVGGGIWISIATSTPKPGDQLAYPISWTVGQSKTTTEWGQTRIEIREDGTATLTDVLGGAMDQDSSGQTCIAAGEQRFSGEGDWRLEVGGGLIVEFDGQYLLLNPSEGIFVDADWTEVSQLFCDGTALSFGGRSVGAEQAGFGGTDG